MAGRFSLEAIFRGNDRLSRVVGSIESNFGRMSRAVGRNMRDIGKVNDKILGSIGGVAKKAAVATVALGGLSAFGAGYNIAKTATDFEQAITNVGAVALQSRDQIGSLETKALELGRDTQFTATQAANAMEIMKRAGFSNAEVLAGIGGVLDATAASGMEMAEVAGIVSNVLKGMGMETMEATRVSDVLALASSRTNSTIGSLGESMSNVASTARQLNIPLEDTVAAVAMLQDVGLDASVAGSAFNTMLTQMANPTGEVAAKMRQWGVSFKDAKGNMLPLQKVLGQLSIASAKSGGTFDKVAFFADLVGMRGQKAASNLSYLFDVIDKDTGKNKVQALTEELQGASGAARKMADIRMDTLQGDITLLGSSLDLVKIAAFESAGKGLRPLVQELTNWLNVNKDMIGSKATEFIKDFRRSLPDIVYWLGRIWMGVKVFGAITLGVKAITVATATWNALAAANPWVLAFGAMLTAATLLVAFWPQIKSFFADHKLAITVVATALMGLSVAMYGPTGVNAAMAAGSAAIGGVRVAAVAAQGALMALNAVSFAGLLAAIGVVAVAVGAVVAMIDQIQKFNAENEGGITGTIGNMVTYGTMNPFEANDQAANDAAMHEAANRPQVVAPRVRAHGSTSWADGLGGYDSQVFDRNTTNEVVIKDETGRAKWTTPPKKGTPVRLQPSGAF